MPTLLEIKDPTLTYCKKNGIHCPCPKCTSPKRSCLKTFFKSMEQACDNCNNLTKMEIETSIPDIFLPVGWKLRDQYIRTVRNLEQHAANVDAQRCLKLLELEKIEPEQIEMNDIIVDCENE